MPTPSELATMPQVPLKRAFVCANCETISVCPTQCPACANTYNIILLTTYFDSTLGREAIALAPLEANSQDDCTCSTCTERRKKGLSGIHY